MKLKLTPLNAEDPYSCKCKTLYEASFPPNERRPFTALFTDFHGKSEVLAALDADRLVGFIVLLSYKDITHILYFAVLPELRDRGYGSHILKLIRERYPKQKIIADLETPEENSPNEAQRDKRIAFYMKNGFRQTEVDYRWEGEDYIIYSNGGNITRSTFGRFWQHFYSDQP